MTLRTVTYDDATLKDPINWNDYFIYDEECKSGLRLKITRGGRKLGSIVGTRRIDGRWSLKFFLKNKMLSLYNYRVIYEMHNGPIPDGMEIDHIDGNAENNNITNLRLATRSINSRNMKIDKRNTTGFTGVNYDKSRDRWVARWSDLKGKQCYRSFPVVKHGFENAFKFAVDARKNAIKNLNNQGAGYTARHGMIPAAPALPDDAQIEDQS